MTTDTSTHTSTMLPELVFLLENGCLRFGDFTLKSGQPSPYFMDLGQCHSGSSFLTLGGFYAEAILNLPDIKQSSAPNVVVFGPAYKGIALAMASAAALSKKGCSADWLFDRKEEKQHGDGGWWVGGLPKAGQTVVLVDDVVTDGGTKYKVIKQLRESFPDSPIAGLVIAFNRMQKDDQGRYWSDRLQEECEVPVRALVTARTLHDELRALSTEERQRRNLPENSAQRLADYLNL